MWCRLTTAAAATYMDVLNLSVACLMELAAQWWHFTLMNASSISVGIIIFESTASHTPTYQGSAVNHDVPPFSLISNWLKPDDKMKSWTNIQWSERPKITETSLERLSESYLPSWRVAQTVQQPAARWPTKCFGIIFRELSCHLSLYTVSGSTFIESLIDRSLFPAVLILFFPTTNYCCNISLEVSHMLHHQNVWMCCDVKSWSL